MSDTRGHGKRTKSWGEAWGRRASFAGIVGWWLDRLAKRLTHRAERRETRRIERAARCECRAGYHTGGREHDRYCDAPDT